MRETTTAYERLGRSFVVHQARANVYTAAGGSAGVRFGLYEQDGMSDFARGYSTLPVELRDSMFAGLADYVVDDLLVWVRRKSVRLVFSIYLNLGKVIVLRALIDQTAKVHSLIDSPTLLQVRLQAFPVYTDHSSQGLSLRTT